MSGIERLRSRLPHSSEHTSGNEQLLDALESTLLESQDYHRLFDARLIRTRLRLGLPISRPASLSGIPHAQEGEFRDAWFAAARDVGHRLLKAGRLADAWAYFRAIDEPEPVRQAIEQIPIPDGHDEQTDELLSLALHEGAHIVRGLQILLQTHGTCNTVTAVSQLMPQMKPSERRQAAALLVNRVYEELRASLQRDIARRQPVLDSELSVGQLIAGREWLFEDGNYHIDVSHLHSTVSFARHLTAEDSELTRAIDLCRYGVRLSENLQYPADVPFDRYYEASEQFLNALAGIHLDEAMLYFISRLSEETEPADRRLTAFVLVDLGRRVGRTDEALAVAAPDLAGLEDSNGFSFTECCLEAGRPDLLESCSLQNDDVLSWTIAQLSMQRPAADSSDP